MLRGRVYTAILTLRTLLIGGLGGFAFAWLGLPAPWLSGAMVAVALSFGLRLEARLPDPLRDLGMLFAGVAMGSAITPDMLAVLARYPGSLAMLILTTFAIILAGRWMLVRLFGWHPDVSFFAALPGAMSAVLASAAAAGVDMARVASLQSFRLFILVAMLPSVVSVTAAPSTHPPLPAAVSVEGFAFVMAGAVLCALVFVRLNILAPFLLGGMAFAGATHATGFIHGALPMELGNGAMFLIGVFAASRFNGLRFRGLVSLAIPGLALFAITVGVAVLGALITVWLVGTPLAEALVAFAPGGLEAMVVLGIALGLDPLYITSHHVARFVLIAAALPFLTRWMLTSPPSRHDAS